MVDNVTISTHNKELIQKIKNNLNGAFSPSIKRKGIGFYYIYNTKLDYDNSHLEVLFSSQHGLECKIIGSIRKWYYGKYSLADLSYSDMPKVFLLLAQTLSIDLDELKLFAVSKIEIGLNIKCKYNSTLIKSLAVKYISAAYKIGDYDSSRYFSNKKINNTLKIYDKIKELKVNATLIKDEAEEEFFKKHLTSNITRIELVYKGHQTVCKYSKISNVGDIINRYYLLTISFAKAMKKITFKNSPTYVFTPINGTQKELTDFIFSCGIDVLGEVTISNFISKLQTKYRSSTRNAIAKKDKSNIKQGIESNYLLNVIRARNRELFIGN